MLDAILIERTRRGDAEAFERLVRRHYRAAYGVALAVLGNSMDAEDVTQDAFIRALDRLDELRQHARFKAWLLQIVRNRAKNFRSYQQLRSGPPLEMVGAASEHRTDSGVERGELRAKLEAALGELDTIPREVVVLHDLTGLKHREIAATLGISEVMSRQHLFQARRRLRQRLGAGVFQEYVDE